jgi:uncharacterized protein (TIGR02145 family)
MAFLKEIFFKQIISKVIIMKKFIYTPILFIIFILGSCELSERMNTSITTMEVTNSTAFSAEFRGKIESSGDIPILSRGFCWGFENSPTLYDNFHIEDGGTGEFQFESQQLNAGKIYHARSFYINEIDTIYGNQVEFETPDYLIFNPELEYGTVTDIDGNVYQTIKIGEQTWMAENLRALRYQNGDPVDHETDLNNWGHFQIQNGAYIHYDNNPGKKDIHGVHYNWYAAVDERNIAPVGWHVPTVEDWQKLINFLDPLKTGRYGHMLRETTTSHWYWDGQFNNSVSSNSTGFTAIPSGKIVTWEFMDKGLGWAYYWTSTGTWDGSNCVYLFDQIIIDSMQPNARGFNIRCVKD